MFLRLIYFAGLVGLLGAAAVFAADEKATVEGTLSLSGRSYPLKHVVAYETKDDGETLIIVLASDRKISAKAIAAALREGDGSDDRLALDQPHLRVVFRKSGESAGCTAAADGNMFDAGTDTADLKLNGGRAQGRAVMNETGEGSFNRSFDIRFDVPVGLDKIPKPETKPSGPVKPVVTGTFKGNGKDSKLAFVSARPDEPFADQPSIVLLFTEKVHSKADRPDFKAAFGEFGSALIISLHENGRIFGCQVSHAALDNQTFTSLGSIRTAEFDVADGQVSGQITTDGEVKTFDKTWQVDLKFTAPFTAPQPTEESPNVVTTPPADEDKPQPGSKTEPTVAAMNIHDFPFPKDAAQIEYKTLVEQMAFKSPSTAVPTLAAELSKQLKAQGWQGGDAELVTTQSAILTRSRGDATLTIFVNLDGQGSTVLIMASGLDWSVKEK